MPQEVIGFDKNSVRMIAKTTQIVLGKKTAQHLPLRRLASGIETWAKIISSTKTGSTYFHAWTERRRTVTGFEDVPNESTDYPALSGTTSVWPAIATDGSQVANDTTVRVVIEEIITASTTTIVATIISTPMPIGCGGE